MTAEEIKQKRHIHQWEEVSPPLYSSGIKGLRANREAYQCACGLWKTKRLRHWVYWRDGKMVKRIPLTSWRGDK